MLPPAAICLWCLWNAFQDTETEGYYTHPSWEVCEVVSCCLKLWIIWHIYMLQIVSPMKYTYCKSAKYIVSNERPAKTNFSKGWRVPCQARQLQIGQPKLTRFLRCHFSYVGHILQFWNIYWKVNGHSLGMKCIISKGTFFWRWPS